MLKHLLKLQRVRTRTVGDKDYFKNQLTLPGEIVEKKKWAHGDEIDAIDGADAAGLPPQELKRMLKDAILLHRGKQ